MLREAATANITVHTLRRNISVLEGSGGNIAALTGKDGKVLVDAGFSASRSKISASLASLSEVPITHLINTHWHIDHTDGNE
jgi:glyoxylase-like metal-dependent hydrolase (beta-lactamase superfamily II)